MKVLNYETGFIEVHENFLVKYKIVRDEIIKSFFILQSDNYFLEDLRNTSCDVFKMKYHGVFERLYNHGKLAKDGIPFNKAPIMYEMTKGDDVIHVLVIDEKTNQEFHDNIRYGYTNIKATVVKRIYHLQL